MKDIIPFPNVNPNGSLLNTVVLTTCNDCFEYEGGEHEQCSVCGSTNVEIVKEEI